MFSKYIFNFVVHQHPVGSMHIEKYENEKIITTLKFHDKRRIIAKTLKDRNFIKLTKKRII